MMDGYAASSPSPSYLNGSEATHHGSVLQSVEKTKKLESSVFNHVSLGQWEAARACLSSLAAEPDSRDNARQLLKILVTEATTYWSESAAVPSPHHLAWLTIETYKTLFPDDKELEQLPGYVQDLVEFRLLLFAAKGLPSFSTRVATDLCNYHAVHVLKIPGSVADTVPQLQPIILQFLHDVIASLSPTLGHALITSLVVPSGSAYLANNEALQMIYVECINETLEALAQTKVSETADNDSSYDSQYESDHPSSETRKGVFKECEKKVTYVYTLLSLIDPSNEMTRITNRLDRLFHTLLKTTFKTGPGVSLRFDTGKVYACLLGRSSPLLINRLHEVEEYLRMNRSTFDQHEEEGDTSSSTTPTATTDVHHDGHSHHPSRKESPSLQEIEWKERFYEALYDHKHLLEGVIDNGLQMVFTGKLPELSQRMLRPEYVPLRPVLLLLGWDRYSAAGSGRELLDSLWPMEVSMKQSLLFDGCCKLAFQVELVQWCLDKARPHVQIPTLLTINRAGDMFKGLETHSTLYVLHHSTPLASLDPAEVIQILKMRPKVPSLSGGSGSLTPPPQFSREATPMKLLSESDTSPSPSPMFGSGMGPKSFPTVSHSVLKPEQERDIAIFRSFCAMRLVMDAIWNSVQLANNTHPSLAAAGATSDSKLGSGSLLSKAPGMREQRLLPKAARKLDLGGDGEPAPSQQESDSSKSTSEKSTGAKKESEGEPLRSRLYRNLVFDKLHEAKLYLSSVHPLNYRLEVLENIFSLLFLTSDEIRQPKMSEGVDGTSLTPPLGGVASTSSLHKTDSFSSPGNLDSLSTAISSIALIKSQHTFLIDEDVASDILDMLKDCIFELRAAKFVLTQQNEAAAATSAGVGMSGELSPTIAVKSSVPHTSLHPRSSKLEQFINEARWRLKLVSSKYGITAGLSPAMALKFKGQPVTFDLFSSSDESVFELSDSEDEKKEKEEKEVRKRVRKKTPSSEAKDKDATGLRVTPTPQQPDIPFDGKSPHVDAASSIGGRPFSAIMSSQLSSPAPRPRSITPKARRSLSPVPLKLKRHGSSSGPISKVKASSKGSRRGSRHTSPSSSAQAQGTSITRTFKAEDDSGDYAADVEEKSPDPSSSKKRKRLKSRSSQMSLRKRWQRKSERSESGFSKNSVVCKMLASPGSLLRMCLKHGNYTKAKEVVKMFAMEGKFGDAFIKFSEDFEQVSSELSRRPHAQQQGVKGSHSSSPSGKQSSRDTTSSLKGKSEMKRRSSSEPLNGPSSASTSLQVAILNATSSSGPLDCLHRLLVSADINRMLFSGDEQLEKVAQESAILRGLSDHVQALIMLDLVCSSRVDGQLAKRIVEMAVSRSQSHHSKAAASLRRVKGSHHPGSASGELVAGSPFLLLQTFFEVAGYFTYPGAQQQSVIQQPYGSPHSLLSGSLHQLDVTTVRNSKTFVDNLRNSREKLEYIIGQKRSELSATTSEILLELSQSSSGTTEETPPTTAQQQHQSTVTVFDDVVRALSGTPDFLSLSPSSPSPSSTSSSSKEQSLMRRPSSSLRLSLLDDSQGHRVRYAYVRQFSRYLIKLVELLIKCLAIAKSDVNKETLLVSVLREGPSQLLGWLVFEQGIQPHRLEAVMGDFPQLSIVGVLVKCCCPPLPSNAALSKRALHSTPPVIALNNHDTTATPISDPCELSYKLLNKLTNILKNCPTSIPSQGGVVTPDDLVHVYNSPKVQTILQETAKLASVDLSLLDSPTKKMVFFANVANLLYAHALMVYFVSLSNDRGSERGPHGISESDILMVPSIQSSSLLQSTYFTKVGYRIGQLGLVSCFDLHHTVLRRGLARERGTEVKTRLEPVPPDPWCVYAPPTADPRLLYVIHDGRLTSPVPIPLTVEEFESTIKAAEQSCINSAITINMTKRALHLPQWLYKNREHLGKLIWEEGSIPADSTHSGEVWFLSYIQMRIEKDKADWLKPYADVTDPAKSKKVTFNPEPDSLKLGYNFGSKAASPPNKSSPRGSPKMRRKGLSRELSRKELSLLPAFQEAPTCGTRHSFTPETIAFIKQRSPLISALVHLVSPAPPTSVSGKAKKSGTDDEAGTDDVEQSIKKSFMHSLRSSKKQSSSPTHKRSTSVDEQQAQQRLKQDPWKRQYDEVLSHFDSFPPMGRYLTARLTCFEAVIAWDLPSRPREGTKPSSSAAVESGRGKSPTEVVDGREFPVTLRRLAALSTTSDEVGEACSFVMKKLVEEDKMNEAIRFLSSEPAIGNVPRVRFLKDVAICSLFVASYRESTGSSEEEEGIGTVSKPKMVAQNSVSLLSQLSDTELAARLTLSSLQHWPVNVCVDLLSFCYHHVSPSSPLNQIINDKLQRMRVYSQIMATCSESQRASATERPWQNWSELEHDTESRPDYVMGVLLTTKKFELIRRWVEVHSLEARFSQQIEVEYLFDLLEGHNSDPITAHQVLDGISDEKTTFKVCEALLNRTDLQTSLFVLHYMLTRLSHSVAINRSHYSNRLLGAKALLCLPLSERKTYENFLHFPLLLVEELLIDSKIEWAGKVIGQLRANEHLSNISTVDTPILERRLVMPGEVQEEEERDDDPFTTLLMFYCDKALEFPQTTVVQSTPADSLAPSMGPTSPPSPGAGSMAPAPSLGASQRLPSASVGTSIPGAGGNAPMSPTHRSGSLDLWGQYPIMTPKQTFVSRKRGLSNATSPLGVLHETELEGEGGEFRPPPKPPTKHQWESDSSTKICRVCKTVSFNMFVRRHHCRRCGRVVCHECSNRTAVVKGYNQPVRVCNDCYPHCTSDSALQTDDAPPNISALDGQNDPDPAFPSLSPTHLHHWVLIPSDPHYNQTIRKAFYYERVPNTTLFLSLLDLIKNKKLAAAFILDCCRTVSLQLMPDSTYSDEIDHNFVIELIQNLLMNAKLRFANSSDSAGVELCDTYLSRVELLHLLVTSQCSTIPSLQELTNPDLARRVRDKLIQDDRFSLAMEVSTKCQLDASAVWSAWGMMALKSGDFKTARAKFIRCFQVSSQSKLASSGGQNLQLLHRIVEQIEQYPLCVTGRQTQHSEEWTDVLTGSMAQTTRTPAEGDLEEYRSNECVYYLRTYGNHSALISFYVRHSCWKKAAKYIQDNRCSVELFVDFFWVPALKMGQIQEVEGHLKLIDPSLEVWHSYLTAACRYFTQKALYSVLYHTQLFMNDQIRAGMTCTKFFVGFSGRSTTISELHSRLHYLDSAKRHFQDALDAKSRSSLDRPWGGDGRSGRSQLEAQRRGPAGTKSMSAAELEKHLATIDLQIKVTNFLSHNASDPSSLLTPTASAATGASGGGGGAEASLSSTSSGGWGKQGGSAPPTLFGGGHMRAEVAVQVLTLSQDIVEGNSIAREIIQMYKLPITNVYCSVSRVLASKQQYGDIRLLLQCIQKAAAQTRSYSLDALCDDIIMAAIKVLSNQAKEAKQADKLIQLLSNERSKIKAYIQCGRFKNAYLIAIKTKLVDEVRNIYEIAGRAGQLAVRDICEKWLAQQQQQQQREQQPKR